jgi:hypothetical protein
MKKFLNFFTGMGLFFIGIAAIIYLVGVSFRSNAELTTGAVTGFSTVTDSDDNSQTYCPIVQFSTETGQQVTYYSSTCNSPPAHQVGDQVEIYYDPENPEKAQIKGFWSQYLVVTILSCIGLPFVLFGSKITIGSSSS